MYTILVNHDNELIATQKQAIMQHSKLVDELRFLVPPDYDDLDMGAFNSAVLEYVSPVSKTYRTSELTDGAVTLVKLDDGVKASLGKADTAVQKIEEGEADGFIKVDNKDVAVHGLASAAFVTIQHIGRKYHYAAQLRGEYNQYGSTAGTQNI